jgi:MinD-like ATPase involved in chromosome partitioning or flagellar assembly
MAIVTFYRKGKKETGQTLSLAAIATNMAIEHNYKILIVDTAFETKALEECFWSPQKKGPVIISNKNVTNAIESGIEGLSKVITSNKTTPEIVRNYCKTILRERLDFLPAPSTTEYKDYAEIAPKYVDVLNAANRYYDYIFVDLYKDLPANVKDEILQISEIVVYNILQNFDSINAFLNLRSENEFFKRRNIMVLLGRCDLDSKYNAKNVTRYLRERNLVSYVPYNTLFFEACSENKLIEFLLKFRKLKDDLDRNAIFMKTIEQSTVAIIDKLHEVQMRG